MAPPRWERRKEGCAPAAAARTGRPGRLAAAATKPRRGSRPIACGELLEELHGKLWQRGFEQRPQITASQQVDAARPFGLDGPIVPNANPKLGRQFTKRKQPKRDYGDAFNGMQALAFVAVVLDPGVLMELAAGGVDLVGAVATGGAGLVAPGVDSMRDVSAAATGGDDGAACSARTCSAEPVAPPRAPETETPCAMLARPHVTLAEFVRVGTVAPPVEDVAEAIRAQAQSPFVASSVVVEFRVLMPPPPGMNSTALTARVTEQLRAAIALDSSTLRAGTSSAGTAGRPTLAEFGRRPSNSKSFMGGLPFCAGSALISGPAAAPCSAVPRRRRRCRCLGQLCVQRGDEHSFFETLCD